MPLIDVLSALAGDSMAHPSGLSMSVTLPAAPDTPDPLATSTFTSLGAWVGSGIGGAVVVGTTVVGVVAAMVGVVSVDPLEEPAPVPASPGSGASVVGARADGAGA